MGEGLTRHEAIHGIAFVLLNHLNDPLTGADSSRREAGNA
jgi:hypothetical protein